MPVRKDKRLENKRINKITNKWYWKHGRRYITMREAEERLKQLLKGEDAI